MPALSLIFTGRNDGYMGDFTWRLSTALNYLGRSAAELGRLSDVEAVIVDWGSVEPLSGVLPLEANAAAICLFVEVPEPVATGAAPDATFPFSLAQNAGIRRATGDYIGQTDADVLFTPAFLGKLLRALDGADPDVTNPERRLIVARRKHIPVAFAAAAPNIPQIEKFITQYGDRIPQDYIWEYPFAGALGLMLLHRDLWFECGGYDERMLYFGWVDIDLGLRITRTYAWTDLSADGCGVYHIEHSRKRAAKPGAVRQNPHIANNWLNPNGPRWGLPNAPIQIVSASPSVLESSDEAFSPEAEAIAESMSRQIDANYRAWARREAVSRLVEKIVGHKRYARLRAVNNTLQAEGWAGLLKFAVRIRNRVNGKLQASAMLMRTRLLQRVTVAYLRLVRLPVAGLPPSPKGILILKLDTLGDVVLASSFFQDVRTAFPAAHITVACRDTEAALLQPCPHIDRVVAFTTPRGPETSIARSFAPIAFGRRLRRERRYDLSINPRWDKDGDYAAVMAAFAGARYRVGFSENVSTDKAREYRGYDRLMTLAIDCEPEIHEVEKGRMLLEAIVGPIATAIPPLDFWAAEAADGRIDALLEHAGIGAQGQYMVVCPSGGRSPYKAWPLERFIELIRELRARTGGPVVLAGSGDDAPVASEIVLALGDPMIVSICGALSISESADLVRRAALFIGCDSGLAHVAAAVGTPQVTLFGSSCAHRFRPWSPVARTVTVELPCGPCAPPHTRDRCATCIYDRPLCMARITVESVLAAVPASAVHAVTAM